MKLDHAASEPGADCAATRPAQITHTHNMQACLPCATPKMDSAWVCSDAPPRKFNDRLVAPWSLDDCEPCTRPATAVPAHVHQCRNSARTVVQVLRDRHSCLLLATVPFGWCTCVFEPFGLRTCVFERSCLLARKLAGQLCAARHGKIPGCTQGC